MAGLSGDILCQAHVQSYGTMPWVTSGSLVGTTGKSKRLEAIRIKLTGEIAQRYDVYYSTHCQKYGWMNWTKGIENDEENGGWCGTNDIKRMQRWLRLPLMMDLELVPVNC